MARCERCGNDYDQSFTILLSTGDRRVFDSFECAISSLAPKCTRCGISIVGHGIQAYGAIYCCAHCARGEGIDRVGARIAVHAVRLDQQTPTADTKRVEAVGWRPVSPSLTALSIP